MNIGFDNSARLCRNTYYFEYKGTCFKLIQNNTKKWCDVLLTIVPDYKKAINDAYVVASEFLSALSWENDSRVRLRHLGGHAGQHNFQLKKAKCTCFDFPEIPFYPYKIGFDICMIPEIETKEQKTALILFREALSANNKYLSFLFYWQVLEIGRTSKKAINWVNNVYKKEEYYNRLLVSKETVNHLLLSEKNLGEYLYDDCRNAIAHIERKPGRVKLKLDTFEDDRRIAISMDVVKKFARFYIEEELKLNKKLNLVRKK